MQNFNQVPPRPTPVPTSAPAVHAPAAAQTPTLTPATAAALTPTLTPTPTPATAPTPTPTPATAPTPAPAPTPATAPVPTYVGPKVVPPQMGVTVQKGTPIFSVAKKPVSMVHKVVLGVSIFVFVLSIVLFIIYAVSASKENDENPKPFLQLNSSDWFRFGVFGLLTATVLELTYLTNISVEL